MKNPETRKQLRRVLKAAICGAILFDSLVLIDNLLYFMWRHGYISDFWSDFFYAPSIFLLAPYILLESFMGSCGGLVNAYTVDGLLGAAIFIVITSCHQFIFKKRP
jgi:hypothetical protein